MQQSKALQVMTRAKTPNICDNCQQEMPTDQMSYTAQFSQRQPYGKGKKGQIVSSTTRADFCKKCFNKFCEGNYSTTWTVIEQQADKSWKKLDETLEN